MIHYEMQRLGFGVAHLGEAANTEQRRGEDENRTRDGRVSSYGRRHDIVVKRLAGARPDSAFRKRCSRGKRRKAGLGKQAAPD